MSLDNAVNKFRKGRRKALKEKKKRIREEGYSRRYARQLAREELADEKLTGTGFYADDNADESTEDTGEVKDTVVTESETPTMDVSKAGEESNRESNLSDGVDLSMYPYSKAFAMARNAKLNNFTYKDKKGNKYLSGTKLKGEDTLSKAKTNKQGRKVNKSNETFGQAFKRHRALGELEFEWNGGKYGTRLKGEDVLEWKKKSKERANKLTKESKVKPSDVATPETNKGAEEQAKTVQKETQSFQDRIKQLEEENKRLRAQMGDSTTAEPSLGGDDVVSPADSLNPMGG